MLYPMQSKSMDWFLYDNGLLQERVKAISHEWWTRKTKTLFIEECLDLISKEFQRYLFRKKLNKKEKIISLAFIKN